MKNRLLSILLALVCLQLTGQKTVNEVQTSIINISEFITYVADQFPKEESQRLLLLIEMEKPSIESDHRFFLEQSMKLLINRLQKDDEIAIVVYGMDNQIILDYTKINNEAYIFSKLASLSKKQEIMTIDDGIDIAHQLATSNHDGEKTTKILMLKDDSKKMNSSLRLSSSFQKKKEVSDAPTKIANQPKIGGVIAITALSLLPEILEVIKN